MDTEPSQTASLHSLPTALDVERAYARIRAVLPPTPVVYSAARRAFLKLENLQPTGAYKVRGALNAALAQVERGDRRPLVAASAGNHAQGIAWAARHAGLAAWVVVPRSAPAVKLAGARSLGANVVVGGATFEACLATAREIALQRGARFVHAFDDPEVIAGQGTTALELATVQPDAVVVPIGGGGLAAGVGLALRALGVRVIGAQIEGIDAMRRVLAGAPLPATLPPTLADGVRVQVPGEITRRICAKVLDDIVLVTEDEVRAAVVDLAIQDKLVAEGAGAVAVAALAKVDAERPLAVVSGGNIDFGLWGNLGRDRHSVAGGAALGETVV